MLLVLTLGVATVALAQPRRGAKPPKPKPTPAVVDAGTESAPADDTANAAGPAASAAPAPAAASDAGAAPMPKPEVGDGGVKMSPLNPAANEFPATQAAAADYDKLLGDIAALRARVAAVTDTMFHSRIGLAVQVDGDHAKVARFTVSLDDGVVYTSPANWRAEDMTAIYEHGVAPGKHAVTVDVDRKDDRDETFRTAQRSRFIVDVPKDEKLELQIRIGDDSTMGADFPSDRSGRYDLRVRAKASSKPVGR